MCISHRWWLSPNSPTHVGLAYVHFRMTKLMSELGTRVPVGGTVFLGSGEGGRAWALEALHSLHHLRESRAPNLMYKCHMRTVIGTLARWAGLMVFCGIRIQSGLRGTQNVNQDTELPQEEGVSEEWEMASTQWRLVPTHPCFNGERSSRRTPADFLERGRLRKGARISGR